MTGCAAPFDVTTIRAQLDAAAAAGLTGLTVLAETDSTNGVLARMPAADRHAHAVLADCQTAGRGRRNRNWYSPAGGNLYLSVGWRFALSPSALGPLPLACAVIVGRELEGLGLLGVGIKWPNDLQVGGRKLGGILVESQLGGRAVTDIVVGVGINVRLPPGGPAERVIDQPFTDLQSHLGTLPARELRDRLAGRLVGGILSGLAGFGAAGFTPFAADWDRLDVLRGREVTIVNDGEEIHGTALGPAPGGALRVRLAPGPAGDRVREFLAGEVSVRRAGV